MMIVYLYEFALFWHIGLSLEEALLRVEVNLKEHGQIEQYLKDAAHPELNRRAAQYEIARLKHVARGPHQNHHNTSQLG